MSRFVDQMDEVIFYDEVVSKADYPDDLDIDEILASLNLDVFAMTQEELEDALEDVMRDGGRIALSQIGIAAADEKIVERVNQRALTWAKERAADLVNLGDDGDPLLLEATRSMLRATIASGIENNLSTKDIGELIEENYAFSEDRAQLIAATEITSANSMGALASYEEASAEGVSVKKSWLILEDACDICQENADAGAIDLDEEFPSGDMAPGAHPNCRCVLVPEVEDESGNVTQGDEEEGDDVEKFDESQVERDENGRFASGGGVDVPVSVTDADDFKNGEISDKDVDACRDYSNRDYEEINQGLRDGDPPYTSRETIASLDRAIASSTTTKDTVVYRGISESRAQKLEESIGGTYKDDAFISTSMDPDVASSFDFSEADVPSVLQISLPAGSNALSMHGDLSMNEHEKEVLLPRGSTFKIESVHIHDYGRGQLRVVKVSVVQGGEG